MLLDFASFRLESAEVEWNRSDWWRARPQPEISVASFCWTAADLLDDDDDDDDEDDDAVAAEAGVNDVDLSDDENRGREIIDSRLAFWRSSYAKTSQLHFSNKYQIPTGLYFYFKRLLQLKQNNAKQIQNNALFQALLHVKQNTETIPKRFGIVSELFQAH